MARSLGFCQNNGQPLPDEELLEFAFIQKVQKLIASGQGDKVHLTIFGSKLVNQD